METNPVTNPAPISDEPVAPKKKRRTSWLLVTLGLALLLVTTPFAVGKFLPARFSGSAELELPRPPAEVWARLTDPHHYPLSVSMCKSVEDFKSERSSAKGWREDIGSSTLICQYAKVEEAKQLVIVAQDSVIPMKVTWTIELTPTANGTKVHLNSVGHISEGPWQVPLFRCIMHLGGASAGPQAYLKSLAGAGI